MPTTMVDLVKSDWRSSKPYNVISLHLHGASGKFWVGLQLGFLQTNLYTGWEGPQVTFSASQLVNTHNYQNCKLCFGLNGICNYQL